MSSEVATAVSTVVSDKLGQYLEHHPKEARNIINKAVVASLSAMSRPVRQRCPWLHIWAATRPGIARMSVVAQLPLLNGPTTS